MNVLVTGGTGFIGSHLVKNLCEKGHKVIVMSTNGIVPGHLTNSHFKIAEGDFSDEALLERVLPDIDTVVHLAWSSVPSTSIGEIETEIFKNVSGTIKLLNKCVQYNIKKFIFISSGGTVYGIPRMTPINEEHPLDPISSYGVTKVAIEKYLHLYNKLFGLDYLIFRVSNAYGEHQNLVKGQGVLGIWLNKIASGKPLEIWGDGNLVRDYICVDDVAEVIATAISMKFQKKVYNLGSGEGVSLNEIVKLIKDNVSDQFILSYHEGRNIDVPVNILDIGLLRSEINYLPSVSLESGIIKIWNWIKDRENG